MTKDELDKFIADAELNRKFTSMCGSYWQKYLVGLDDFITEVIEQLECRVVGDNEACLFLSKETKFNPAAVYADGVWKHVPNEPTCVETILWKGRPIIVASLFSDNYLIAKLTN